MTYAGARRFGIEKAVTEPSRLRKAGYQLLGEIHIPGRIRLSHIFKAIAALKLPERGLSMLDAGTGRGDLALHYARLHPHWTVRGIEIEQDRVERCIRAAAALELKNVSFARDDLLQLKSAEEYDLITNTDVLEHIEDDRAVLARFAAALKPRGHLVLTFPSSPQRRHLWTVRWRERRIGFHPSDIGHVREGYGPAHITKLLSEVGLETVLVRWTYGFFGNLAHDIFFTIGDSKPNPLLFAAALPLLLGLSFLEVNTRTTRGSGLLVIARKP